MATKWLVVNNQFVYVKDNGIWRDATVNDRYILGEDKEPIECDDLMLWAVWMQNATKERLVAQETITVSGENVRISTVFLALDHNWNRTILNDMSQMPILWETMIFGGEHDGYQERYCTYKDAVMGHVKAVRIVTGLEEED